MKKGQASITGFIITIVLIITVVSLFYTQFSLLLVKDSEYVDIRGDSEHVASVLVSEGFPKEWNTENVKKVGLLDGEKISLAKLTEFSSINYSTSKKLLGIRYDYMLFIEKDGKKQIVPGANKDFIGWNGYIETDRGNGGYPFESFFRIINQNAEHIAKNEKFIYIEDAVIDKAYAKLIIFTWDPVPGLDGMNTQCVDG
ncbi:MAG: hypothetical protein KAQ85_11665, partial [Thermodesulfovibrionia bacterium]|nr:hypothetical protein [Thermodesulfovibrionia bacterium]